VTAQRHAVIWPLGQLGVRLRHASEYRTSKWTCTTAGSSSSAATGRQPAPREWKTAEITQGRSAVPRRGRNPLWQLHFQPVLGRRRAQRLQCGPIGRLPARERAENSAYCEPPTDLPSSSWGQVPRLCSHQGNLRYLAGKLASSRARGLIFLSRSFLLTGYVFEALSFRWPRGSWNIRFTEN